MLIWVSGETSGVPAAGEIVIGVLLVAAECAAPALAEAMPGRITATIATSANSSAVRRAGTEILAALDAPPSISTASTGTVNTAATGTKPLSVLRDAVSDSTALTYNALVTSCQTPRHTRV
jgi:hypothetical protein